MLNSFTTLNSFFSWFELASEASASLFMSASPGAASISAVPLTAINEDHSLYAPSTAAGRAAPLVVMLNGAGQNPGDFAAGTANEFGGRAAWIVVLYPAQGTDANAHQCWNWFERAHQTRSEGDPARIVALTLQVARARC